MKHMLAEAESAWLVADAVARGAAPAEVEALLQECDTNLLDITDREGRSLLQLAAATSQGDLVEWLVKSKGADLD